MKKMKLLALLLFVSTTVAFASEKMDAKKPEKRAAKTTTKAKKLESCTRAVMVWSTAIVTCSDGSEVTVGVAVTESATEATCEEAEIIASIVASIKGDILLKRMLKTFSC